MEWSAFIKKYPNGKTLSALQAAKLLIDLRTSCVLFENEQYLYMAQNVMFLSEKALLADRIYYTNESSVIYPELQLRIEQGGTLTPGQPGSDRGPPYDPSILGTHTISLQNFYEYLPVCTRSRIRKFLKSAPPISFHNYPLSPAPHVQPITPESSD